jgi:hypothetical protein
MKSPALIIAAALLWMGCGKGDDVSKDGAYGKDSASAKKHHDATDQTPSPVPKPPELPAPKPKIKPNVVSIPTRGTPTKTITTRTTPGTPENLEPPSTAEAALIGSWTFKQGEFVYTIILEKEGHGKVRIATGDQKADFPVTWTADASNLTLTSKDEKTHAEDVDKGTYKLDGEHLQYDLEGEHFPFTRVKE